MAVRIEGIRKAQQAMLKAAAAGKPDGALGAAVKEASIAAHRYAVAKTHVDTGALRASQSIRVAKGRGEIYLNPSARRSDGKRPAEYGVYEHRRGGTHAFYERVMREDGRALVSAADRAFRRYLP